MQDTGYRIRGTTKDGASNALNPESKILNPDSPHSLFISDLHLSADHSDTVAAFLHFLSDQARHAEALYILGDLFEYWAGDDDNSEFHQQIIAALHKLETTRLYLMRGNRDLLMGEQLASACSAELLPDPCLIDLYGAPTLLSHGDALCTDDIEYQKFRKMVRSEAFQKEFLARPLAERKSYIAQLRGRSLSEKMSKSSEIMDVNQDALHELLREFGYPRLIHGHTHRPARHEHPIDGHLCERWVLSDWETRASALRCDQGGSVYFV